MLGSLAGRDAARPGGRAEKAMSDAPQRPRAETAESRALSYWHQRLAQLPAPLALLGERQPRAAGAPTRGSLACVLPAAVGSRLARLSDDHARFATLLALLQRYTGQEDLLIALPVALLGRASGGEPSAELLVLRADASGGPALDELVQRHERALEEACAHAELRWARLAEELPEAAAR